MLVITSLVVAAYYLNHPHVESSPDTAGYLHVVDQIRHKAQLVNPVHPPGYPLFILLIFGLSGASDLFAVSIAQGVLFVIATLEVYVITCLISRRAWVGAIVALIAGTNTYQLAYSKPAIVEGFALWLVVTLALAVVLFIRNPRIRHLWLVAGFMLLAFMTRPEWAFAPIPLFGFLLLVGARAGRARRLALHSLAAVVVLYGVLGLYIAVNAAANGYRGISVVERANLLGKVMQYDMQDEAPPRYANVTRRLDAYLAHSNDPGPYDFANQYPAVEADYWKLGYAYSRTIVLNHPLEFLWKTIPIILHTSWYYYATLSQIDPNGPYASGLRDLQGVSESVHRRYGYFPIFCLAWFLLWGFLLIQRRSGQVLRSVEMMIAICGLAMYELVMTSTGSYADYMRLHVPFNPLRIIAMFGSVLIAVCVIVSIGRKIVVRELAK